MEPGPVVLEVPQTFHRGNWPFAAFLVFLGLVLAIPAWLMGNHAIAVALFFVGLGVAFVFFLVGRLAALRFPTLVAVHEKGLLIRQRGVDFVPWRDFERLERWSEEDEGFKQKDLVFLKIVLLDGRSVSCGTSVQIHDAILARAGLSPTELGRKSGWSR